MIRAAVLGLLILTGSALAQQPPPGPSSEAMRAVNQMVRDEVNRQLDAAAKAAASKPAEIVVTPLPPPKPAEAAVEAPAKPVEPAKLTIVEISDPPPPATTVLQQLALAAVPVLVAIMPPLVGSGLLLLQRRIGIQLTEQQQKEMAEHKAQIYNAAQTGVGNFFTYLATGTAKLSDSKSNSLLIQSLAANALASVPEAVAAVPVSHDQMARIIAGAVGRAISADPTIPTTPILATSLPPVAATVVGPIAYTYPPTHTAPAVSAVPVATIRPGRLDIYDNTAAPASTPVRTEEESG